jgi:hypothetical protein
MKVLSKSFLLHLEETITIGELKVTALASVMGTKEGFDIEFADHYNIFYMGLPIEGYGNWSKFRDFHKEMGIDFDKHLTSKFEEIFTVETVKEFVNKIEF